MLEEKDIQKIGEEVGKVIEQNITPVLDEMNKKIDKLDQRVGKIEGHLDKIDGRMDTSEGRLDRIENSMVTKAYLDDKLSDFADNLAAKKRKEDGKINRLIGILKDKSLINEGDIRQLKDSQALPQ